MATHTSSTPETTLQITRTYSAPREKVFEAWTDPKILMKWFAPSDDFTTPSAEVDLRVGGKYRIQMTDPTGESHTVVGTYREIASPEKLVFTFAWEGDVSCGGEASHLPEDTLVTLRFKDLGGATELAVTHEFFPDSATRDKHGEGWTGCLGRLPKVL